MTVADLIELLQMFPPTATVTALGALIDGASYDRGEVELQLDADVLSDRVHRDDQADGKR